MTITVRKRRKYGKQFIVIIVCARNPLRDLKHVCERCGMVVEIFLFFFFFCSGFDSEKY